MSTAAGVGSRANSLSWRGVSGSQVTGSSHCCGSWCGCVPARRARMIAAQSRVAGAAARGVSLPDVASRIVTPPVPSASPAAALDAAGGELGRVEQFRELLARQVGHLGGDLADRSPLRVGLLGDGSALFVTDYRVERGHQDRVA